MDNVTYSISLSEILVAVLFLISGALGYIIKRQHDKIKDIQLKLSDRKHDLYMKMYNVIFDIIKDQKTSGNTKGSDEADKKIGLDLIEIKKDLLLYAPDNVVKQFIEWNRYNNNNPGNKDHFKYYLKALMLLRKDMGQKNTSINETDFLYLIMGSDKDVEQFKKILNL
jgi:hypothetical protein